MTPDAIKEKAEAIAAEFTGRDDALLFASRGSVEKWIVETCTTALTEAYERGRSEETDAKNAAYRERNQLVAALSKIFPSYLATHDANDATWDKEWMWIVYVELPTAGHLLPTGNVLPKTTQVSWHIHNSDLSIFSHLSVKENNWDGHTTEEKYARLAALTTPNT